jgi:NlpC/P60 family protein
MNKLVAIATVTVLAPVGLVLPLVVVVAGGAATTSATAAAAAATAACTYATPDADRIALAMEQLTTDVVDETHWNTYVADTDLDRYRVFEQSTAAERHQVLVAGVRDILYSTPPNAITTPPIIWWHTTMPADNDDTAWETSSVPGWTGTLADYITEFANAYAINPTVLATISEAGCVPPNPPGLCPQPANTTAIMATTRDLESGDNYTERSHSRASGYSAASGNPSGAYQYTYDSWNHHGGYTEAYQAPAAMQDARATIDITTILAQFAGVEWIPVAWYVGLAGAERVRTGQWPLSYIPNPVHNTITIGDYQARWLQQYTTIALPAQGIEPVDCPQGATAVIVWAGTQLGAPYAAIDPYRFGTPTWPGGTHTGFRGDTYTFPAGTTVYDCSGFVIAAWRAAGVDLAGQYGLYSSQAFNTTQLPDAPHDALQPGDIAVYKPTDSGVGHIVLIHDIDPATGAVRTIEASPTGGVHIGTLNWTRVTTIKRPAT